MKKFLALVLALVMTMSLVTISAGAEDFTDDSKITYGEAVDVMTAIGVVGGYADGSFNPTGTLTRGAAAKIICNMILGPTEAGALATVEAPFKDVPADHVFAGYIAYCASEGIISGYSDGTFRPSATLTGYAFWKMLLGALGYDAANENYTGTNYAINVAKRGLNIGLDDGLEGAFTGGKALTREEACLYAFNTLKATMVEYDNNSKITIGDLTISNSTKAEEVKTGNVAGLDLGTAKATTLEFAEKYFTKLDLASDDPDTFGRPAHSWTYDKDDIGTYADDAEFVFTAATKAKDIAPELKGYKVAVTTGSGTSATTATYKIENDTDYSFTIDGDVITTTKTGKSSGSLAVASETLAKAIADETANGKLVEIYTDDDKVITDIVILDYSVAKVTKVSENKKGDVTYTIDGTGYVDYADDDLKDDTIKIYGTIAKGDYVTYVKVGSKAYVWTTEYVVGAQSDNDNNSKITVNGEVYELQNNKLGSYVNSTTEYKYFIDQYGYVVATDSAASASTNYAYVVSTYAKLSTGLSGSVPTVEARVVLADGTIKDVTVALEEKTGDDKGDYAIKELDITIYDKSAATEESVVKSNVSDALNGKVFGYTLDGDTITFEALTQLATTGNTDDDSVYTRTINNMTKGTVKYTQGNKTVLMDKDTVFVAYNSKDNKTAVYTGVSNLPSDFNGTNGEVVLSTGTTANVGTATVVFVSKAGNFTAAAVEDYVYIDTTKWVQSGSGSDKVWKYTGTYADGTTVTLTAESQLSTSAAGVYTYSTDLKVTSSDKQTAAQFINATGADMTVEGNLVCVGSSYYYITEDTAIVYIDDELSSVDGSKGWVVLEMDGSTVTNDVETIFVTAD